MHIAGGERMNEISLLKDEDRQLITIGIGKTYATVSVGEWSNIIAHPRKYRAHDGPLEPMEFNAQLKVWPDFSGAFHAPDKDSA